jgi:hypothetical protein
MAKEDDVIETWSIDSPLEEFTMEMVNYPLPESDAHPDSKRRSVGKAARNGKPKAARSKARQKKPGRRGNHHS